MSDPDPIRRGAGAEAHPAAPQKVGFDRRELDQILQVYGRKVASGEWRDYAMEFAREVAVFAVFERSSAAPLYRIEKRPKLKARQGAYAVIGEGGHVLKRGHELAHVLRVLEKKRFSIVD
jgi:hypothetical protein